MSESVIQISGSEKITLDNRGYRLIKKLGEGSFAKVYLGEFQFGKDKSYFKLACKIIDTRRTPSDYRNKFLRRELQILATLSHPHIIAIHSIFKRYEKYFIFMRFAERGDLYDVVQKNGAVAEQQAKIWIRQIALALEYLHVLDIAHRDIKLENILVTQNYNVKLTDFGFARCILDDQGESAWSETFCGSLAYVAPEILKGNPYRPKPTDMWSFGVMIYVMLNKANPFNSVDMAALYRYQINKRWRFRTVIESKLSQDMKDLVQNLLEPDPTKRLTIESLLRNPLFNLISSNDEIRKMEEKSLRDAHLSRQQLRMNQGISLNTRGAPKNYTEETDASVTYLKKTIGENSMLFISMDPTTTSNPPNIKDDLPIQSAIKRSAITEPVALQHVEETSPENAEDFLQSIDDEASAVTEEASQLPETSTNPEMPAQLHTSWSIELPLGNRSNDKIESSRLVIASIQTKSTVAKT